MSSVHLDHPFKVTETSKHIAFIEYSYETSYTDLYGYLTIAKTQIDTASVGWDALVLGNQWSMYLNHRLAHHHANEKLFGNTYDYWVYSGDWFGQVFVTNNLSFNASASWQSKLGGDAMVSGDQFYLGNSAGVRGYDNDVLSSENGFWVNLEAQYRWIDAFNTFVFFDAGRLSGMSGYEKRELYSVGFGFNWQPTDWIQMKATMGVPLTRQITEVEKADRTRFDATVTLVY
jgi:hemolysin activation/secretion protein